MLMLNKDKSRTHHTHKTIKYCLPNIMKYKNSSNVYCRNPRNAFSIQSCGTTKNRTIVKSTIKNKTLKLDVNGTTKGQIYKLITCKHMQNMMCFFIRITTKKLFSLYNKHKRYLYIDHFTVRKPNLKTNLDF